jgi:hypothetical protein
MCTFARTYISLILIFYKIQEYMTQWQLVFSCVVRWFPRPIRRVRLITSVEWVYGTPPIKLCFYGHYQIICSSSICNIWYGNNVPEARVRYGWLCFSPKPDHDSIVAIPVVKEKCWWRDDFRLIGAQSYSLTSFNMDMCVAFALSVPGKIVFNPVIWDVSMLSWPRLVRT